MCKSARRRFFIAAAALAAAPVFAAVSDYDFKNITDVLYPSWHNWTNRCASPSYPESLVEDSAIDTYYNEMKRYERCLTTTTDALQQRTKAQPLVNPDVWKMLSDAQHAAMDEELRRANQDILARVIGTYRSEEAQAEDALKERERVLKARAEREAQRRQEEASASLDAFRSCARRSERAMETADKLDDEMATLKSDQLQLGMMETRLIGMKFGSSTSDYNNAVAQYNSAGTQLANRVDRYNKKVVAANKDKADIADDCATMRVSKSTLEAVCGSGSYPQFCAHVRAMP